MTLLPKVKLKAVVSFPATVLDGVGIDTVTQNGTYQFNLDFGDFAPPVGTVTDPANQNVLLWNSVTGSYSLVPASAIAVSTGAVPSIANPLMDGAAVPGTSLFYTREDHVHPTDTSRAPLASPVFTGDPRAPTPAPGDNDTSIATTAFVAAAFTGTGVASYNTRTGSVTAVGTDVPLRSYLAGLALSTAGSSASFGIAAGVATDSTNAVMMALASAMTKTTAAWAVGSGNGGLDTGAISAAAWYHVFLIRRPDTGVVDVCISLSATTPTTGGAIPAAYTQFRRIGSMRTSASLWVAFTQLGDDFMWVTPSGDINTTTLSTTATNFVAAVPTGLQIIANLRGSMSNASICGLFISSLDETVAASNQTVGNSTVVNQVAGQGIAFGPILVRTDVNAQIRMVSTLASTTVHIATIGWSDRRGRDV